MLTFEGQKFQLCDKLPRRSFLQVGGLAMGGLSLPEILRAEDESRRTSPGLKTATQSSSLRSPHRAVIMIYLGGGPPHQDMFDLKPDAPSETRGEFQPIATKVPGIQISELMPRVAAMMDKFAVIRSLVGSEGRHDSAECYTGRWLMSPQPERGWPAIGSTISRLCGPVDPAVPPFVDLSQRMKYQGWNTKGSGYLGSAHAPIRYDGATVRNMKLRDVSVERLHQRTQLLRSLDRFRRDADTQLATGGLDSYTEQAMGILTSPKLVEALDLEREDPQVRARYGKDAPDALGEGQLAKGYAALTSRLLLARRAVEAGVRCVTCSFAQFDWHTNNFSRARRVIPLLDQGIAALVEDLHERGLENDVTVVVWGEFGRSPKINNEAGRDHWPPVHAALLAGGGMKTGQVIGKTSGQAEEAIDRPVHMQEVFATMYHNLGIDVASTTIPDDTGRPLYLIDRHELIRELV